MRDTPTKKPKKPIGTITKERAACIAAFKKHPNHTWFWCCHHEVLTERCGANFGGFMERVRYIDDEKQTNEKAVRFRNFRPVIVGKNKRPASRNSFNRQWPDNTWNGHTIF